MSQKRDLDDADVADDTDVADDQLAVAGSDNFERVEAAVGNYETSEQSAIARDGKIF